MKQVWKCDHCSHTQDQLDGMDSHEATCSFNPTQKKCFTCKFSYDSGYDYSIPECEKCLSTVKGRDIGNCEEWESHKKEYSLLDDIKSGNHKQFVFNTESNMVFCRCGHPAPFLQNGYVCGTITAYPCKYN